METTEDSGREARRKRIMERGTDRMALITGRIQTLASPSSSPKHAHTQSSPALFFQDQSFPEPSTNPSDQFHLDHEGQEADSDMSTKLKISDKLTRGNAFNFRGRVEPQLHKCETNTGAIETPNLETRDEAQPLPVTPRFPKASADEAVFPKKVCGSQFHLFTAREINSCIIASENTRVFCSVIIAILVVLSNINLPRNIVKSRSTIASRPLYILLLTDVTIVVVRLLEKRRALEKTEEDEKHGSQEDANIWAGAFNILEMGLVFYQIIRGLFIDCSFYMVVVICGLSLV
ncbi:Endoglucanase [Actinidia chinensis var. chinensis]|uniref:Endoglucanase n=1 Tax=Actinidia chinensis var. chinensis TaxID=1590841 RepID=A0A2R6QZW8_ACTCC|nr:Endoglucanase [Actinidia chinensis var. chinensis]